MATSVVIVEKNGELKDVSVKNFDINTLYRKCKFRKAEGFEKRHVYKNIKIKNQSYSIAVYARNEGKANMENKYELPPPIDNDLYFGCIALVREDNNANVLDLCCNEWDKIYNKLFGGFEDLAATAKEDEEEEDELKNVSPSKLTKQGYLKDGFIVDSNSDNDENMSSVDASTEEEYPTSELCDSEDDGSELEEESYIFSDEDSQ